MIMDSIFNRGFGSQWNVNNWAQIPAAPAAGGVQQLPTQQPMVPVSNGGISSVADYNTNLPTAGGTPVATTAPVNGGGLLNPNRKYGGLFGAILSQFRSKGYM